MHLAWLDFDNTSTANSYDFWKCLYYILLFDSCVIYNEFQDMIIYFFMFGKWVLRFWTIQYIVRPEYIYIVGSCRCVYQLVLVNMTSRNQVPFTLRLTQTSINDLIAWTYLDAETSTELLNTPINFIKTMKLLVICIIFPCSGICSFIDEDARFHYPTLTTSCNNHFRCFG